MSVESLVARQAATRASIETRVEAAVLALWDSIGGYRDADLKRFVSRAVPLLEGAQRSLGTLTATYIAQMVAEMTSEAVVFTPIPGSALVGLRPTPAAEVYARPFVTARGARSRGESVESALALGRDRLTRLISDDLALANRQGSLIALDAQRDSVIGYRRIIRPERSRSGTCGLCIAAANEIYSRGDLRPIHTRCHCEDAPIVRTSRGTIDPGRRLNDEDISEIYAGLKTTDRAELAAARFTVHQHGDLGPVLRARGDDFTGPADLAA